MAPHGHQLRDRTWTLLAAFVDVMGRTLVPTVMSVF
jgi:hypothetical protein